MNEELKIFVAEHHDVIYLFSERLKRLVEIYYYNQML